MPLCGNSIAHRPPLPRRLLPEIEEYLHYRSVDVSTIKELARRWYPEAYAAAPKKAGGHRALDDIKESVAELRYYRASVFKPPAWRPAGRIARALRPAHLAAGGPNRGTMEGPRTVTVQQGNTEVGR